MDYRGNNPITSSTTIPYDILTVVSGDTVAPTTSMTLQLRSPRTFMLTKVKADVITAQSSGSDISVDVSKNGISVLSGDLVILNNATSSESNSTQPTISIPSIYANDIIQISVTSVDGSTSGTGLKVHLLGETGI
jgi:hypothetical protein